MICFTKSAGECKSINRLWILMVYLSHVFVPSPHGALRTVTCNFFVGMRTGPLTFNRFSLAPLIKSEHTFSKFFTFLEERVMRILWMRCASASPAFAAAGLPSTAADIVMCYLRVIKAREERENACKRQRINQRARESLPLETHSKALKGTLKKNVREENAGIGNRAQKCAREQTSPTNARKYWKTYLILFLNERLRLGTLVFYSR